LKRTDSIPFNRFDAEFAAREFGGYRYAFNGKEKENETNSGAYDFGARFLDVRLGRWMSVDPKFRVFPEESPFVFGGNSPVLFLDNEGETKIVYVHVTRKDGKKETLKVVDADYIEYKMEYIKGSENPSATYNSYDIEEHISYDESSGNYSNYSKTYHVRMPVGNEVINWFVDELSSFEQSIQGKGESVKSGAYMISETGGSDPTKTEARLDSDTYRDMDDMINMLGGASKTSDGPEEIMKKVLKRADNLRNLNDKSGSTRDAFDKVVEPDQSKDTTVEIYFPVKGSKIGERAGGNYTVSKDSLEKIEQNKDVIIKEAKND
jgi:RHS repeat-associated protein